MFPATVFAMIVSAAFAVPSLSSKDLKEFPTRQEASAWKSIIKEHLDIANSLCDHAQGHPIYEVRRKALQERYRAWSLLDDAHCQSSDFWTCFVLMDLYDVIGRDAYRSRTMPFPIPLHLYADVTGNYPFHRELLEEVGPVEMEKLP